MAPTTRACFNLPEAGTYAVVIYHDADGDSDFDRSAIGRPTEGFGFSNNPAMKPRAPKWEEIRFTVPQTASVQQVRIRYVL